MAANNSCQRVQTCLCKCVRQQTSVANEYKHACVRVSMHNASNAMIKQTKLRRQLEPLLTLIKEKEPLWYRVP